MPSLADSHHKYSIRHTIKFLLHALQFHSDTFISSLASRISDLHVGFVAFVVVDVFLIPVVVPVEVGAFVVGVFVLGVVLPGFKVLPVDGDLVGLEEAPRVDGPFVKEKRTSSPKLLTKQRCERTLISNYLLAYL